MVPLTKFQKYSYNLGKKVFNLSSDQLKIALTNTAPDVVNNNQYSDLVSPLPITNFSGGSPFNLTTSSYSQTGGVTKIIISDLVLTITGVVAPFRYICVYDDTATNKELIGVIDYGTSITLTSTFTIDFDNFNGMMELI